MAAAVDTTRIFAAHGTFAGYTAPWVIWTRSGEELREALAAHCEMSRRGGLVRAAIIREHFAHPNVVRRRAHHADADGLEAHVEEVSAM
jgi:hypothetical protein